MIPLSVLKKAVHQALRQIARTRDIREAEVFASSTAQLLCRLNYTSEIPCNGVEEPKSVEAYGLGIRAVFAEGAPGDAPRVGFGSEARDISPDAVKRAIEKARQHAVPDPDFVSLPMPPVGASATDRSSRRPAALHDPVLMGLKDEALVASGWRILAEALKAFSESEALASLSGARDKLTSLGLIVGGDVTLVRQRVAVGSTRLPAIQTDESTLITSQVTAMIERHQAKGSGYTATTHLAKFKGEVGAEAVRNAVGVIGGQRLSDGTYPVVLGPQPVCDLMVNVLLPSLGADAFYACQSAFLGEMGRPIAPHELTIYDHGALRGAAGSRRITCEGLPTGRTDLIREGVLHALLSNHYETQRLLRDPQAREKLGLNPREHPDALAPRNGFRRGAGGRRQFDVPPSIAATNLFIEWATPRSRDDLLGLVGNGVYIGRIWYTYPMNGLRAGDFTCTVVGDSYLIRDGRLAAPLQGNVVRITGNIRQLLRDIIGASREARPVVPWGSDEVIYAPDVAVRDLQLTEIAQGMRTV